MVECLFITAVPLVKVRALAVQQFNNQLISQIGVSCFVFCCLHIIWCFNGWYCSLSLIWPWRRGFLSNYLFFHTVRWNDISCPSEVEVRDASGNLKCVTASEFYTDVHFHNLLEVSILLAAKRVNAKSKAINI